MMIVQYFTDKNPYIEDFQNRVEDSRFTYYASELIGKFEDYDPSHLETTIKKAAAICKISNLQVHRHFKLIYRCERGSLVKDWKLTGFASSIFIIIYGREDENVSAVQKSLLSYIGF